MAESAPLSVAQVHARKAAVDTQRTSWIEAAKEHTFAAEAYGRAAKATSDAEAIRLLSLIESQHHRMSGAIRQINVSPFADVRNTSQHEHAGGTTPHSTALHDGDGQSKRPMSQSQTSAVESRFQGRNSDPPPSLAREIASRRGIPQPHRSQQPPAVMQSRANLATDIGKLASLVHSTNPTMVKTADQPNPGPVSKTMDHADGDDSFNRFYNNITHGTMSKLSSVLAYAGLPLSPQDVDDISTRKVNKKSVKADNDPDLKTLFSPAALSALEDDHRQRGTLGHGFGPAESFYVVPQAGGTAPYADVVKLRHVRTQHGQQQQQHNAVEGREEFVDASETPDPSSPKSSRRSIMQSVRGPFSGKSQTAEELELENATLKSTLEQLASRLANFEAHAQDASMALLTQSIIGQIPPRSRTTDGLAKGGQAALSSSDMTLQTRVRELEMQLERQAEDVQQLRDVNHKQNKALQKWDKRFEALNIKAKEKRQAKLDREKGDGNVVLAQSIDPPGTAAVVPGGSI